MQDLRNLAWANPFASDRGEIERRIVGDAAFQPLDRGVGSSHFSPNLDAVLASMDRKLRALRQSPKRISADARVAYEEVLVFWVYHQLIEDLDAVVGGASPRRVWQKLNRLLETTVLPGEPSPAWVGPERILAFFYQVRRAFLSIHRYVIGETEPARVLRGRIWESIFGRDLRRYIAGFYERMGEVHTLITGPSGSGKELVAQAIGHARFIPFDSRTATFAVDPTERFLPVNLASLSPTLVESELFGHAKGAFTGAFQERAGYFEQAGPWGTIFLDEIGEVELPIQAKLLRVLQGRRFNRVGESVERCAEGRVVAATNRDPEMAVAEGRFREDLFFRLNGDRLRTLGLEELIEGNIHRLDPMVRFVVQRLVPGETDQAGDGIVASILEYIDSRLGPEYNWPGNFRELEQCVRSFLVHGDYRPVRFVSNRSADGVWKRVMNLEMTSDELLRHYAGEMVAATGSRKAAAARLGVDPRTVAAWMREG